MTNNNELKLYRVDIKYFRELEKVDEHIPSVSPQSGKEGRPFIGVITIINKQKYIIPLTLHHGKPSKRREIGNSIGYTKILNEEGIFMGGINFVNMVPVTEKQLLPMYDLKIKKRDSKKNIEKKIRLQYIVEYIKIKVHADDIKNKAIVLYNMYMSGQNFKQRKVCLPFDKLEEVCQKYNNKLDDKERKTEEATKQQNVKKKKRNSI